MTSTINDLLTLNPNDLIHDPDFRHVVELHIPYFINAGYTQIIDIPPEKAMEFDGDFYGVCQSTVEAKDPTLHWVNLRLNGYKHPFEYTSDVMRIRILTGNAMQILQQRYRMIHQSA